MKKKNIVAIVVLAAVLFIGITGAAMFGLKNEPTVKDNSDSKDTAVADLSTENTIDKEKAVIEIKAEAEKPQVTETEKHEYIEPEQTKLETDAPETKAPEKKEPAVTSKAQETTAAEKKQSVPVPKPAETKAIETKPAETKPQETTSPQTAPPDTTAADEAPFEETSPPETTDAETEEPKPERNEPKAYSFTVYDSDGNEVHLSDYIGKPIVLNFWASWCAPCKMEMPDFNEKYLELAGEVQFLMVNVTGYDTVESAKATVAEGGYSFPVFFDIDSDAANAYNVTAFPTTYFIDAEGYLIAYARGAISAETLQQGIDMIS